MSVAVHIRQGFQGFDLDVSFEAAAGLTVLFVRSGAGKSSVTHAVHG